MKNGKAKKLTILLLSILLVGLLTGCSGALNLGGILGGFGNQDNSEEFVDPNKLTEIVEVSGVQEAYDAGTKYQFTWEDTNLELSLSATDNTCYLADRTAFEKTRGGYGAYEKVTYYVGTYVASDEAGTFVCTFQDCLQGVVPGEDYNTKAISKAIESMKKKGHYDDFEYAREMALYIERKTLRTHTQGSVKGTLELTLGDGAFTPNLLEMITGLTMAYRMGFQTESYFIGDINGHGVLCRDNWYNYDGILLSAREYLWTEGNNNYDIWFDSTYYSDGKLKSQTDYENNIPTMSREYNENDEVVYSTYYDENGNPSFSRYTDGNLTKEIDHTMVFVDGMYLAKWFNAYEKIEKVALYDAQGNVLIEYGIQTAGQYLDLSYGIDWETELMAGFSSIDLYSVNGTLIESISYDGTKLVAKDSFDAAGNLKTLTLYDENGQEVCILNVFKEGNRIRTYYYNEIFSYMVECDGNGQNMGYSICDLKGNVKYSYFSSESDNTFDIGWNAMEDGTIYYIKEKDANGNEVSQTLLDDHGTVLDNREPHTPGHTVSHLPGHTQTLTFYKEFDESGKAAGIYFYDKNGNEVYSIYRKGSNLNVGSIGTDSSPWVEHFTISSNGYKLHWAEVFIDNEHMYIWEYEFKNGHIQKATLKDETGKVYATHQVYYSSDKIKNISWSPTLNYYVIYENFAIGDDSEISGISLYRMDGTLHASMHGGAGREISLGFTEDGKAYLMETDSNNTLVRKEAVN